MSVYFKVVREIIDPTKGPPQPKLVSCVMEEEGLVVEYKIGEPATPVLQGSRLFVYTSLLAALAFRYRYAGRTEVWRVFSCHAEDVSAVPYLPGVWFLTLDKARQFWANEETSLSLFASGEGMRLASSITLLEETHG